MADNSTRNIHTLQPNHSPAHQLQPRQASRATAARAQTRITHSPSSLCLLLLSQHLYLQIGRLVLLVSSHWIAASWNILSPANRSLEETLNSQIASASQDLLSVPALPSSNRPTPSSTPHPHTSVCTAYRARASIPPSSAHLMNPIERQ